MQALHTLSAGQVMAVAKPGTRKTFMELRDGLKVGRTSDGAPRPFSAVEAAMFTLAVRITAQGLRRLEAISIADAAKGDLARLIQDPHDGRVWMFASRSDDGWSIDVVEHTGSPEILNDFAEGYGFAVINLRRVVSEVLAVGAAAA
jgi:hypothetical protein